MSITVDRGSERPVFRQIASAITDGIVRGRLRPGVRLPGTRTLASEVGVHRQTVVMAYDALVAEGWLTTTRAGGTFVSARVPELHGHGPPGRRVVGAAARRGPVLRQAPNVSTSVAGGLDLSSGQPDLASVPVEELSRAYRRALRLGWRELLRYGDPAGHPRLRTALAHMLSSTRELPAGRANVVVAGGSQMAWTIVGRALAGPGDVIAVEELGYRPAWEAFRQTGAGLVPIPVDRMGLDVEAVDAVARTQRLRAVYLTPHRQYPTTVTMAADRRLRLLDLAAEHRFAVIEDDYDHEFSYDGRPVPPLASLDTPACVVYVGTLSKVFAPGLRIGFVVAPVELVDTIARHRTVVDLHGDHILEAAVAELLEDGVVQRHINSVRRLYLARREVMLGALGARLGSVLSVAPADGGLGLWCEVTDGTDVDAWASRAAKAGVNIHTGRRYTFSGRAFPAMRLSFAPLTETQITDGVDLLAKARPRGRRLDRAEAQLD